jgi:hypothetical protein
MTKTIQEMDFIRREVYKRQHLKNIRTTGYEAFRISPRTTIKYGKRYKRIYGAVVEPDYSRPTGKKNKYGNPTRFGAKVTWSPHGYASPSIKSGTRLIGSLRYYPVDQKEARMKLMIHRKKRR